MPDIMKVQSFSFLLRWILKELESHDSVFGIPRSLFYVSSLLMTSSFGSVISSMVYRGPSRPMPESLTPP